jgi:hypothetical protein
VQDLALNPSGSLGLDVATGYTIGGRYVLVLTLSYLFLSIF